MKFPMSDTIVVIVARTADERRLRAVRLTLVVLGVAAFVVAR